MSRAVSEGIEPHVYPKIRRVKLNGKNCVAVDFSGEETPYLAFGRAYVRVGDENKQLSTRELEKMFLVRNLDASRWEAEISDKRLSDADERIVKRFIDRANLAGRIDFRYASVKNTLNKLGLVKAGRLLKAVEVLFCEENLLEVQAAVFAGTDKRTFLDIKQFKGNLFDLLDQFETYIKEHINWKVDFGKLERDEIPEVPIDALREALVNSLCHRDYRNPKGNEIAVFKDRVEIYNPGNFPEGLTPDDFIKGGERSILRNPLIAEALFKSKDIEKWGSGLKRIVDECGEKDVKVQFQTLKTGFLVAFLRSPELAEKSSEKSSEKILVLLRENKNIGAKEIAKIIGISQRAVEKQISQLKAKGIVKRIGPDKGGCWKIVQ